MTAKHFVQFAQWSKFAISGAAVVLLAGCATEATTVATDVQTVPKPIPVPCKFEWPARPTPYVAIVQLTGDPKQDLVPVERAKEAELEERIAYEVKFEAAAKACTDVPAAPK